MNWLGRRLSPLFVRVASFLGGVAIMYHEVWVAPSAEPLLVFVGLWLAGAPLADLLDQLRRLASQGLSSAEEDKDEARTPRRDRRRK